MLLLCAHASVCLQPCLPVFSSFSAAAFGSAGWFNSDERWEGLRGAFIGIMEIGGLNRG